MRRPPWRAPGRALAALCLGLGLGLGLAQPATAAGPVAAPGAAPLPIRIDPGALREDLVREAPPHAGRAARREAARRDGDDALAAWRRQRSAAWLPRLLAAEAAGDPIATVLLRDCASASALDRGALDTTCAPDPAARERALERLRALSTDISSWHERFAQPGFEIQRRIERDCAGADDARDRCIAEATALELESRLAFVVRHATLDGVFHTNLPFCPRAVASGRTGSDAPARPTDAADDPFARCEWVRHQLLAVRTLARRHFAASLTDPTDEGNRIRQHPYHRFERLQHGGFDTDPSRAERFYEAVHRSLIEMDANVTLRLAKDPRWRAFLRMPPRGVERMPVTVPAAAPGRAAKVPAPSVWQRDAAILRRYVGTYDGALISNGTTRVVTKLFTAGMGGLHGRYMMIYGDGSAARVELGDLGPCLAPAPDEVLCIWRDRHGVGGLSMLFDADGSEFKGMYVRFGGPVEFSRMERRYWNEWTSWNGKLQ